MINTGFQKILCVQTNEKSSKAFEGRVLSPQLLFSVVNIFAQGCFENLCKDKRLLPIKLIQYITGTYFNDLGRLPNKCLLRWDGKNVKVQKNLLISIPEEGQKNNIIITYRFAKFGSEVIIFSFIIPRIWNCLQWGKKKRKEIKIHYKND